MDIVCNITFFHYMFISCTISGRDFSYWYYMQAGISTYANKGRGFLGPKK